MKKLMFALSVCVFAAAFAQETGKTIPAPDPAKAEKRIAAETKQLKLTVEEYKALTPDQIKAKMKAAAAEK